MTSKVRFRRNLFNKPSKHVFLWAAIVILVAIQMTTFAYLLKTLHSSEKGAKNALISHATKEDSDYMTNFVNRIEDKRYKYPVIDVEKNRVYIPEARIYLPLNETTRDLRYQYLSAKSYTTIWLSVSEIVGIQNDQADPSCDRAVLLQTSQDASGYELTGTMQPTKDGLQYILMHKEGTCDSSHDDIQKSLSDASKLITNY